MSTARRNSFFGGWKIVGGKAGMLLSLSISASIEKAFPFLTRKNHYFQQFVPTFFSLSLFFLMELSKIKRLIFFHFRKCTMLKTKF